MIDVNPSEESPNFNKGEQGLAESGKNLLQELVLGRVWCQCEWDPCLWAGREGPPGCVPVHMCVCRQRAGGVDVREVLDRKLECQGSLCHLTPRDLGT